MSVWPRARVFHCEHGLYHWTRHIPDVWYPWNSQSDHTHAKIKSALDTRRMGFIMDLAHGVVVRMIILNNPGDAVAFEVVPRPKIMRGVVAVQRMWRRWVRAERRMALMMGGHPRLGAAMNGFADELLQLIARFM